MKKNILLICGILFAIFLIGCQSSSTTSANQPPQVTGAGTGGEDDYSIWITGSNFAPNSFVELRKSNDSGQPLAKFADEQLVRSQEGGSKQSMTLAVKGQDARDAMNNLGVKVRVVNPDTGLSAESQPFVRKVASK